MTSTVRSMLGSAQTRPLCAASNTKWTCFSLATLSMTGSSEPLELLLQLLRQRLQFLLRVFGEPLDVPLLSFDVGLQLRRAPHR